MILNGDCIDKLKTFPTNYFDAVVTDPPYGLAFMGKKWDYDVPSVEIWKEVLRVLKPGGHLLSFGGTRTYHRMVVNIEDAGFEIRDQLQWIYGQGFPKSHDISKAIDKAAGAERKVIGIKRDADGRSRSSEEWAEGNSDTTFRASKLSNNFETEPATEDAKRWQGWGSALKPANEPICMARKPLEKGLTIAENVLKHGTGGLNIDGCMIGSESIQSNAYKSKGKEGCISLPGEASQSGNEYVSSVHTGRFPSNVLLDEAAAEMLDEQSGNRPNGYRANPSTQSGSKFQSNKGAGERGYQDSGGASRFFYVAKASKSERNAGLEGMPKKVLATSTGQTRPGSPARLGADPHSVQEPVANHHPTVKPLKLMEYLITMVTPPAGIVLDPFAGSGTTLVAAKRLGFGYVGIEREREYCEIAEKRLEAV